MAFDFEGGIEPSQHLAAHKPLKSPGRYAFGLPAGSVRALLAFLILGLVWALMIMQRPVPLYLQYVMFIILGHYFAAHSKSIKALDEREPVSSLHASRCRPYLAVLRGF
ncbi:MAG: hypothetical protein KatS3mg105_2750 [Gemmatales bacterium]|nr:MAG: hypothetical protein KatS3mg105_2750 [Gemmatales bacterium]